MELSPINPAAPFIIGRGMLYFSRRAWIVAIEPRTTGPSHIITGGPSPMAPILWNISIVSDGLVLHEIDEHSAARYVADGYNVEPIEAAAAADMLAEARQRQEERRAQHRAEQDAREVALSAAKESIARYAPAGAVAAIVAELDHDDSDSMTDYFNHKTSRRVVIGWSTHKRDLFPELRKAAATFEPTADLATAPDKAEHREKYSMGAGFYLKHGWRDSNGWSIKKRSLSYLADADLEFSAAAKGAKAAPIATGAAAAAGGFTITQHVHSKKGFDMWICTLADRIERDGFDALLTRAKALGGWYSRAWAGVPAGFAFKDQAKAAEFTAAN